MAEKKAALDVVFSRLKQAGLEDYCFELHSDKTNISHVRGGLEKSYDRYLNTHLYRQAPISKTKIKKLITKGNKRFANRKDRDYLEELLEIGITESLAWQEILTLSSYNYVQDYKPFYSKSENSLVFKKDINGNRVYIKLKIEEYNNKEMTVCLSFHLDYK